MALIRPVYGRMVGESPQMAEVYERVLSVAGYDSTVLITGETGTGKELVAEAIHKYSEREGKFYPQNCGALPVELFESELFGVVKGGFTDAVTRAGAFRTADKGTLFLDEVGDMIPYHQVKLLRVLDDGMVSPVGTDHRYPVDVRIVAASNKDVKKVVNEGGFREDLYYRLNVVPISLPPLRNREGDVELLARYFLQELNGLLDGRGKKMGKRAMTRLTEYPWPGNVRELSNVIEAAYIASGDGDVIDREHLIFDGLHLKEPVTSGDMDPVIEEMITNEISFAEMKGIFGRRLATAALERCRGNVLKASKLLRMQRSHFYKLIKDE